ncbi:unnamed protein product [Adineta steineri]|uniref:Methyltransferase FkbM domain-containing protein n=2 Tax=Adineta steineri TaxID=433720 RepID=A0A814WLY5_9BILA|nr:unnamed protein product [Adineta steineri]CAF3993684.1 unnamed protein product [Adineta steineri]
MVNVKRTGHRLKFLRSYYTSIYPSLLKYRWYIFLLLFLIFLTRLQYIDIVSPLKLPFVLINAVYSRLSNLIHTQEEITTTPVPEVVINVKHRIIPYKLALRADDRPFVEPDHAQDKLLKDLQLYETCKRDPSTIVVDVGAHLGDFGLYAAACGCTVYMFEPRPHRVTLLRSSIQHNSFPTSRVHLFHKSVSDCPSNSTVNYPVGDIAPGVMDDNPIVVETIRLDDVAWSASTIFILKIDAEGSESKVIDSAKKLFAKKRIRHLIFNFYPWGTTEVSQSKLLPHLKDELKAKSIYCFYRGDNDMYGPLRLRDIKVFHKQHSNINIAISLFANFEEQITQSSIQSKRYQSNKHVV